MLTVLVIFLTSCNIKEGLLYDLTANVDVEDGMVNGAECHVRYIEKNPVNKTFPKCIWIEFLDSAVGRNLQQNMEH